MLLTCCMVFQKVKLCCFFDHRCHVPKFTTSKPWLNKPKSPPVHMPRSKNTQQKTLIRLPHSHITTKPCIHRGKGPRTNQTCIHNFIYIAATSLQSVQNIIYIKRLQPQCNTYEYMIYGGKKQYKICYIHPSFHSKRKWGHQKSNKNHEKWSARRIRR